MSSLLSNKVMSKRDDMMASPFSVLAVEKSHKNEDFSLSLVQCPYRMKTADFVPGGSVEVLNVQIFHCLL